MFPRKRHQMRHLCDLPCLLAKQVLSQLSYTPPANSMILIMSLIEFCAIDYLLQKQVVSSKADMPCALQPLNLQGLTVICSETLFLILSPFGPIHVFRS